MAPGDHDGGEPSIVSGSIAAAAAAAVEGYGLAYIFSF